MRFMVGGRQIGKTTVMLEWFLQDPSNRYVYVPSMQEQKRLVDLAVNKFIERNPLISQVSNAKTTFRDEFKKHFIAPGTRCIVPREAEVGIDNLDMMLHRFGNVTFITATGTTE